MPFMECRTDGNSEKCKKSSGDDWSYWLTAKTSDANILVSPPQPLYMLMSQISRCAVCKSASPQAIIVKHKTAPGYPLLPDCPAGSTRLWSGYSFLMGAGTQSGERIIADLSSTGSCLERFQPIPFVECKQEEGSGKLSCDFLTQGDFGYWMVRTGPTSKFGDITGSWVEPNVATCVVCAYSQ